MKPTRFGRMGGTRTQRTQDGGQKEKEKEKKRKEKKKDEHQVSGEASIQKHCNRNRATAWRAKQPSRSTIGGEVIS
jgi:hypothetical protein